MQQNELQTTISDQASECERTANDDEFVRFLSAVDRHHQIARLHVRLHVRLSGCAQCSRHRNDEVRGESCATTSETSEGMQAMSDKRESCERYLHHELNDDLSTAATQHAREQASFVSSAVTGPFVRGPACAGAGARPRC